jgi:serine/threonine protein kinase
MTQPTVIKTELEVQALEGVQIGQKYEIKGSEYTVISLANLKGYKSGVYKVEDEYGSDKCLKLVVKNCHEYEHPTTVIKNNRKLSNHSPYFVEIKDFQYVAIDGLDFCAYIEDWVDGVDLDHFISKHQSALSLEFIHSFALKMCEASKVLSEQGLQHGDLHHGNIMITKSKSELIKEYTIKIVDFGSVKPSDHDSGKKRDDYLWFIHHLVLLLNEYLILDGERREIEISFRRYREELKKLISAMLENREGSIDRSVCIPEFVFEQLRNAYNIAMKREINDELSHPFDYMSAEHIASDKLFKELYIDTYPLLKEVINKRTPVILTGNRGCGKSSLFRRYSLRLNLDDQNMLDELSISGFYIPLSSDFRNKFGYIEDERKIKEFRDIIIHYFNLLIVKEVVNVLKLISLKKERRQYFNFTTTIEKELYTEFCDLLQVDHEIQYKLDIMTEMSRLHDIITYMMKECYMKFLENSKAKIITHTHFIKDMSEILYKYIPYFKENKITYLLDDYSRHRVSTKIQEILSSIILDRQESYIFKISAEKYGVYKLFDSMLENSPTSDESREYDEFDITEQFTDLRRTTQLKSFVVDFLDRRLELSNYQGRAESLLGQSTNSKYSGLQQITSLFSGDTSVLRLVCLEIFNMGNVQKNTVNEISSNIQDSAIKNVSHKFCEHVKIFKPFGQEMYNFLKKYGEFAQQKYKLDNESKPRIECHYEDFSPLSPEAKQILIELLRRGIFIKLRDSASIRTKGSTLRLHLRRIFNPNFQFPFQKDSACLLSLGQLNEMLLKPELLISGLEHKVKENGAKETYDVLSLNLNEETGDFEIE